MFNVVGATGSRYSGLYLNHMSHSASKGKVTGIVAQKQASSELNTSVAVPPNLSLVIANKPRILRKKYYDEKKLSVPLQHRLFFFWLANLWRVFDLITFRVSQERM